MLNYCGLHYSRSNESMVWAQTSNVGITGTWVMKFGEGFDKSICEPLRGRYKGVYNNKLLHSTTIWHFSIN